MFINILERIQDEFGQRNEVLYHPSQLYLSRPTYSTGPLHIIFRTFRAMGKWLMLNDEYDLNRLLYKKSNNKEVSAAILLGSSVFDLSREDQGIYIYVGSSSNSVQPSPIHQEAPSGSTIGFRIQSTEWDTVNETFKNKFQKLMCDPALQLLQNTELDNNNYFQIIWSAYPSNSRSQWSADSTHTGSCILGSLVLVLPSIEIQGRDMLQQLAIPQQDTPDYVWQ